jgi:hypothetical protein
MSRHSHRIWGREGRMRVLGRGGVAGEDIAHMTAAEVEGWAGGVD